MSSLSLNVQAALLPSIRSQAPDLSDLEREALRERVRRERAREGRERESLAAAAERACRIADCGCTEPEDYLKRPLESAHRCPNPVFR